MSYDYGLMNLNKIIEYAVYFDVGMENRGVCVVVQSQAGAPPPFVQDKSRRGRLA